MKDKTKLTDRDRKIFDYLLDRAPKGMPTVREICRDTGITSTSSVHRTLEKLSALGLIEKDNHTSRSLKIKNGIGTHTVPIIGKVTAGVPILAVEDVEGYLQVPETFGKRQNLFALSVVGLSMKNAGILDGDIVVADKEKVPMEKDIVVALIDDEATVKRLGYENGTAVLYPENPDFSPIRPEKMTVLGTVVGSYRKY